MIQRRIVNDVFYVQRQCGEEYLNGVTLKKIESILKKLKGMLTEIAVVDYNKAA